MAIIMVAMVIMGTAGCRKEEVAPANGVAKEKSTNTATNLTFHFYEEWLQTSVPRGYPRKWPVGFSIGSKGYMGAGEGFPYGGGADYSLQDFWQYDPSTNAWTQQANLPYSVRSAVSFVIGTKAYVCLGYHQPPPGTPDNPAWIYHVVQYDQASNAWTYKADFPGAARYGAVGATIGNYGYLGTGSGIYDFLDDWWQYDPSADHWTQKASFIGGKRANAAAFGLSNVGYVGTGWGFINNAVGNDFYAYFPGFDAWAPIASLPAVGRNEAMGFTWGQYGVITCGNPLGSGAPPPLNDFWYYQPSNNQWYQGLSMSGAARAGGTGFSINGTPYVGAGYNYYTNIPAYIDFWYLTYVFY
jgi:N-acetylneuraminic acid mutarotase